VALMITGMMKHFIFHIPWTSTLKSLYFHFFSASFCVTSLLDGIAMSINILLLLLLLLFKTL